MKKGLILGLSFAVLVVVSIAGCDPRKSGNVVVKDKALAADPEATIKGSIEKLDPEDQKLAMAQKWCAVETDKRLGDMGKPYKVILKDQPVFLCCKGCLKEAEEHAEKTLATVAELKAKAAK